MDSAAERPSRDTPPPAAAPERVNILMVDDRPENLVALEATLASPEYNLVKASSGPEALRAILRTDFALILLDVLMPEMDGFEVAALIKQREPTAHTPIIFLTAAGTDMGFLYRGYNAGAVDYLVKPIDPDVVRAKVAVFVELHRKNRQIQRQAELLRETERRERALQLAELRVASQKRYQNLAEAIPQIVWTARPDGSADYFNQRWHESTGVSAESAAGWGWLAAVHPEDAPRCREQWRAALRAGTDCQFECRLRRADGEWAWQLCRARPERNRAGVIVAWLGTYTDIDERKQAEEERARLYGEAQAAVRARDEFLSIASHELKTPLTALKLHTKTLARALQRGGAEAPPAERLVERLETIDRQVDRLTKLINSLLDVSRITAGRIDLELEDVDLGAVVRDTVERLREESERAGCSLTLALEPASVVGHWDALRLDQVVTNLISNAIKYGAGRPVHVVVEATDRLARVTVRDQGIGIAPENQARIFQRFERAVSERQYGGFGLGLWIVRQIVNALGGEITVQSVPGEGSTFTVELPRARVERAANDRAETTSGAGTGAPSGGGFELAAAAAAAVVPAHVTGLAVGAMGPGALSAASSSSAANDGGE